MQKDNERGSNLVEMGLAMFILAFLLIGVLDIGRAFQSYIVITNASREGARRASRLPDKLDAIRDAVIAEAANSNVDLSGSDASIDISSSVVSPTFGLPITVTVRYTLETFIGGLVGLPEMPMRSSTTMVIYGYKQ